jgi:hypothetical protein
MRALFLNTYYLESCNGLAEITSVDYERNIIDIDDQ